MENIPNLETVKKLVEELENEFNLESRLSRYKSLTPELIELAMNTGISKEDDATRALFLADFVITSSEVPTGVSDEDRRISIIKSFMEGLETRTYAADNLLKIFYLSQKISQSFRRNDYFLSGRGLDRKTSLVILKDLFFNPYLIISQEILGKGNPSWELAILASAVKQTLPHMELENYRDITSNENLLPHIWKIMKEFEKSHKVTINDNLSIPNIETSQIIMLGKYNLDLYTTLQNVDRKPSAFEEVLINDLLEFMDKSDEDRSLLYIRGKIIGTEENVILVRHPTIDGKPLIIFKTLADEVNVSELLSLLELKSKEHGFWSDIDNENRSIKTTETVSEEIEVEEDEKIEVEVEKIIDVEVEEEIEEEIEILVDVEIEEEVEQEIEELIDVEVEKKVDDEIEELIDVEVEEEIEEEIEEFIDVEIEEEVDVEVVPGKRGFMGFGKKKAIFEKRMVKKTIQKPITRNIKKIVKKITQKPIKKTVTRTITVTEKKPIKKIIKKMVKKTIQKPEKKMVKKTVTRIEKKTIKDMETKIIKKKVMKTIVKEVKKEKIISKLIPSYVGNAISTLSLGDLNLFEIWDIVRESNYEIVGIVFSDFKNNETTFFSENQLGPEKLADLLDGLDRVLENILNYYFDGEYQLMPSEILFLSKDETRYLITFEGNYDRLCGTIAMTFVKDITKWNQKGKELLKRRILKMRTGQLLASLAHTPFDTSVERIFKEAISQDSTLFKLDNAILNIRL